MKMLTLPADDELAEALEEQADREGKSVETLALDLLRREVTRPQPPPPSKYSFIGIGRSGKGDLSVRAEELLEEGADPRSGWALPR